MAEWVKSQKLIQDMVMLMHSPVSVSITSVSYQVIVHIWLEDETTTCYYNQGTGGVIYPMLSYFLLG